ncbi:unnamed protein product [Parascedosporium putredinis]|uniref:Uncharacterized protein n=1 Tax=Parascedosporium putredinis TaxID=1442378 RepID=A0A9P1GXY9_9PEZI|nr:unnamed protein product [Parascedosporium putredinis]CAI7989640.1 unnamed protein product [Parascedosporium putredinis]
MPDVTNPTPRESPPRPGLGDDHARSTLRRRRRAHPGPRCKSPTAPSRLTYRTAPPRARRAANPRRTSRTRGADEPAKSSTGATTARSTDRFGNFPQLVAAREPALARPEEGVYGAGAVPGPDAVFMAEPPRLNYTLRTRKMSIFLWWSVIIFDSVVMPIALYFGLWYGVGPAAPPERQKLSANAVFSIVTAAIGGASILEYFLRMWNLWKKDSDCRVIGAGELIIVQKNPYIRLIAMSPTTMLFVFGTELLIVDILRGAQLRPCIYSLVEDICAVDGGGGTAYREALDTRYEASHIFRAMLRRLGVFWAVGAEAMAVLCTILIFTLSVDYAYTIGWTVPFVWAGVWALVTTLYVQRELKREDREWARDMARKQEA